MADNKNVFTCSVTWENICKLSLLMTNGLKDEEANQELVYMADNSFGSREWDAMESAHRVDNGCDGDWIGFQEASSSRFLWGSASSGATIEVVKYHEFWELTFTGTNVTETGRESWYATAAAMVVTPRDIQEIDFPETVAFLDTVRVSENDVWVSDEEKLIRANFLEGFEGIFYINAPLTEAEQIEADFDSGRLS